ncbi:hypothetical protein ACJZ2D_009389 [Fusarium nematophilum]
MHRWRHRTGKSPGVTCQDPQVEFHRLNPCRKRYPGGGVQEQAFGSNLKPVTLELGGKSPVVVFPDADLDKVAQNIAGQLFLLNAQMKAVVDAHKSTRVLGQDPLDINTAWSPVYNHRQNEVVKGFLSDIHTQGTVVTGIAAVEGRGCYVQPTIVRGPFKGARVERESFGPILAVGKFATEEEALAKANDTETGLTVTLCTKDFGRILHFSKLMERMEAGLIQANRGLAVGVQTPFPG